METMDILEKRINENLELLETLEVDSDEYERVTKVTNGLLDRYTNMKKIESDGEIEQIVKDNELEFKKKSDRRNFGIAVATILVTIVGKGLDICWKEHTSNKLLEYEKEGMVNSMEGRSWFPSLFKK